MLCVYDTHLEHINKPDKILFEKFEKKLHSYVFVFEFSLAFLKKFSCVPTHRLYSIHRFLCERTHTDFI